MTLFTTVDISYLDAAWSESKHKRGQPGNAGQFGAGGSAPKSGPAFVLAELNAKNAPDDEYKNAFSTGQKNPLKKGETWRGRLEAWAKSEADYGKPKQQTLSSKTPIASFVANELKSGSTPEQIAAKLKVVTKLHKNPGYVSRMLRSLEKQHGLRPKSLG